MLFVQIVQVDNSIILLSFAALRQLNLHLIIPDKVNKNIWLNIFILLLYTLERQLYKMRRLKGMKADFFMQRHFFSIISFLKFIKNTNVKIRKVRINSDILNSSMHILLFQSKLDSHGHLCKFLILVNCSAIFDLVLHHVGARFKETV